VLRQSFKIHVTFYLVVNVLLIGIWAASGGGYFWPVWPILGWGIGLVFHAWDVYGRLPGEEQIHREMERLR